MSISFEVMLFIAALLVFFSVFFSKASDKFGVPALLIFLLIGILAGSEDIGRISFNNYDAANYIGIVALAYILFSGGVGTNWRDVKPVFKVGVVLATAGVLLTAIIMAFFASFIFNLGWRESFLLGAIVSSTDAAAVFSVLRSKRITLNNKLRSLLEFESASNDPMAVFLTVSALMLITSPGDTPLSLVPKFVLEMGVGCIAGLFFGWVAVKIINKINLDYDGLYPVLLMTLVMLIYSMSTFIKGNGFLAVYIAGIVIGNSSFIHKKSLVRFQEGLAWLMQITMFLALGLLLNLKELLPFIGTGILAALVLMFIARPISVYICTVFARLRFNEKAMVSWVGLRGAVPIILAMFPFVYGIAEANKIFNIVFFIVFISALTQGVSLGKVADLLKLSRPLTVRKRYPIEFEQVQGINADLFEIIVPLESSAIGKKIVELKLPARSLVALISRGDGFLIPNGSTVIEDGDIFLALGTKEDLAKIQNILNQQELPEGK
ncbi:MAG: potassium/proton antiporter [Endomicrobia bacterium]|nr:potassium/proton antiporter [Endomicrobiia bacterium]MCL2799360.1 potassium/proton antiporter [Endomicrobiia bacterium]